jgi:hypothetical protein
MADSIKNERTIDAEGLGEEAGKLAPKVLHAGPEPTGQPYVSSFGRWDPASRK